MAFDEYRDETNGVRPAYADVALWIDATGLATLDSRREEAEAIFRRTGITFAVYGEGGDPERLIPFDLIPRVFSASEWRGLAAGIRQRARALNAFIHDVYHRAEIVRAGRVPRRPARWGLPGRRRFRPRGRTLAEPGACRQGWACPTVPPDQTPDGPGAHQIS